MSSFELGSFRHLTDAKIQPGGDASLTVRFEREHGFRLPADHAEVLQRTNGAELYAGYFRLFGIYTTAGIDSVVWNRPDCWKFAWGEGCAGYWSFAETAWGDQYAYSLEALRTGGKTEVYFLDAFSMTAQVLAGSFAEFLTAELIPSARMPRDTMTVRARERLGPLETNSHLVYIPSILLGGAEDIDNVQKMNARAAVICNGDIATQLDAGPPEGAIKALEPYEDEFQRPRIRLLWS